jgi:hypothetical protein
MLRAERHLLFALLLADNSRWPAYGIDLEAVLAVIAMIMETKPLALESKTA